MEAGSPPRKSKTIRGRQRAAQLRCCESFKTDTFFVCHSAESPRLTGDSVLALWVADCSFFLCLGGFYICICTVRGKRSTKSWRGSTKKVLMRRLPLRFHDSHFCPLVCANVASATFRRGEECDGCTVANLFRKAPQAKCYPMQLDENGEDLQFMEELVREVPRIQFVACVDRLIWGEGVKEREGLDTVRH
jgi:hypothetical protein